MLTDEQPTWIWQTSTQRHKIKKKIFKVWSAIPERQLRCLLPPWGKGDQTQSEDNSYRIPTQQSRRVKLINELWEAVFKKKEKKAMCN